MIKAKTPEEVEILDQIDVDHCAMETWHTACGTSHCLAGWAQWIKDDHAEIDLYAIDSDSNALAAGLKYLPNISILFYAPTVAVQKWLREKQYLPD